MGDLTKNLSRREFTCKCGCGMEFVDIFLVKILQDTCDHFSAVFNTRIYINISSANRCINHNETVQKTNLKYVPLSSRSKHMFIGAADYGLYYYDYMDRKRQVSTTLIHNYLAKKYPATLGLGVYDNFNHTDIRKMKARWDRRT